MQPLFRHNRNALLVGIVLLMMTMGIAAAAETYAIDPVHTSVVFRVKHLGVTYVYGRFNDASGTIVYDAKAPENSSIEMQVLAQNVDTANSQRDNHLRSPDFFDAAKFPTIQFKSSKVLQTGTDTFTVAGDLSLHGQTRPLTVTVQHTGAGNDPWGGFRRGFETVFEIKRSEFGMTFMQGGVGDDVELRVSVQAIRK
jgi:polyisoprenoid-binding protein YceI